MEECRGLRAPGVVARREGGFTKAAAALHVAQPSLSQRSRSTSSGCGCSTGRGGGHTAAAGGCGRGRCAVDAGPGRGSPAGDSTSVPRSRSPRRARGSRRTGREVRLSRGRDPASDGRGSGPDRPGTTTWRRAEPGHVAVLAEPASARRLGVRLGSGVGHNAADVDPAASTRVRDGDRPVAVGRPPRGSCRWCSRAPACRCCRRISRPAQRGRAPWCDRSNHEIARGSRSCAGRDRCRRPRGVS